jgi:hypothetical protein
MVREGLYARGERSGRFAAEGEEVLILRWTPKVRTVCTTKTRQKKVAGSANGIRKGGSSSDVDGECMK